MPVFDARTSRVLITILLFGLALWFLALAWHTLVTFLFAILFAYLMEPVVGGLQYRLKLSRGQAVATLYLVLVVASAAFLVFVGPRIVRQVSRLADLVPGVSAGVASGQIVQEVGHQRGWSFQTQYRLQQLLIERRATIARWERELVNELAGLASNVLWVALIPIIAIFFLMSGERFARVILEQLERRRQRAFVAALLHDVHDVLANYIRAQITLTALTVAVYLAGFELMRLPYAVALGVIAGLLEFIPVVGPLLGAAAVLATAFFTNYPHLWLLLVFLGVWRGLQDYFNSPRIMGGQVQLDPLAVLFGVLAGAELGGVIGVYLSIPALATLRVIWIRWRDFQSAQLVALPPVEP